MFATNTIFPVTDFHELSQRGKMTQDVHKASESDYDSDGGNTGRVQQINVQTRPEQTWNQSIIDSTLADGSSDSTRHKDEK